MNASVPPRLQTVSIALETGGPLYLHVAIFLPPSGAQASRILGDETFRLVSFEGQESASELFEFQLALHANTTTGTTQPDYLGADVDVRLNIDDLVGLPITVGINCPGKLSNSELTQCFADAVRDRRDASDVLAPDADPQHDLSFFNGIITAVAMADPGVYFITMGPALAQLKYTNAYTIHANQNLIGAINTAIDTSHNLPVQILRESHINDAGPASLAMPRIQDWLQAGESHYDFIMRLMKKAQLYFYFRHTATSHTVVFSDYSNPDYPAVATPIEAFRYTATDVSAPGLWQDDVILDYRYQRTLGSRVVSASFLRQYANFEDDTPTVPALYQASAPAVPANAGALPMTLFKAYDFGSLKEEVSNYTLAANAALAAGTLQFSGTAFCAQFRVGHCFQLADVPSQNQELPIRPTLAGGAYVLTRIKHQAAADGTYRNEFFATAASGSISGFAPEQAEQQALLAVVVADAPNWQSFTPDYFHPQKGNFFTPPVIQPYQPTGVSVRFAADPENNVHFIKLSAAMQTVPEAGAIVLVSRAQNESELPEIQNVISSRGGQCATPAGWDANTRVGNNYATNFGDNQSFSFGGKSPVKLDNDASPYITAVGIVTRQYATGYFGNTSYAQGASYSYAIAEGLAGASKVTRPLEAELNDIATPGADAAIAIALQPAPPAPDASAASAIPLAVTPAPVPLEDAMRDALGTAGLDAPDIVPAASAPMVASGLLLNVSEAYGSTYARSEANVSASIENVGTAFSQATIGTVHAWTTIKHGSTSINDNEGSGTNVNRTALDAVNINTNLRNSTNLNTTLGDSNDVVVIKGHARNTTIQHGDVTTINKQTGNGKISNRTDQTGNIVNVNNHAGAITTTNNLGGVVTNTNNYLAAVVDTNTHVGAVTTVNTQIGVLSTVDTKLGVVTSVTNYGGIVNDVTNALSARVRYHYGAADVDGRFNGTKNQTDAYAIGNFIETADMKSDSKVIGVVAITELYDSGAIGRLSPGVVETYTSGPITRIVELLTIL